VTDTLNRPKKLSLKSRAVIRTIEPGTCAVCAHCDEPVKFTARSQHRQVIANVYVKGTWNRVEHYHAECYSKAREPYGPAAA
jgi:hypothetical protein